MAEAAQTRRENVTPPLQSPPAPDPAGAAGRGTRDNRHPANRESAREVPVSCNRVTPDAQRRNQCPSCPSPAWTSSTSPPFRSSRVCSGTS